MTCPHVDRRGRRCLRSLHFDPIHTYGRVAVRGRLKARTAVAERAFRQALVERSEGWCEVSTVLRRQNDYGLNQQICGTVILHPGRDPHHRFPEDRRSNRHDPDRGLFVCAASHAWLHDNPASAHELGLLR